MHIVHMSRIVWEHGTHGGMEAHSRAIVEGLRARGHRVTTLTTACPGCAGHAGTRYLPGTPPGRYSRSWWRESARAVRVLHEQQPVDVILSQSTAARGYVLAAPARRPSIPTVVVLHGTLAGELRGRWRNARSLKGVALLGLLLLNAAPDWWLWRRANPGIDRFIAVSEQVAEDGRRTMGIPTEKLSVVVSGIETGLWRPDPAQRPWLREQLGLAAETPVLVAAGRLEPGKGYHLAIDSLAQLAATGAHLVILGGGSAGGWLDQRARAAGVADRVHLTGFVEPPVLARYLQGADLFLMPTLRTEALPLALLQALAAGLPAVASALGGIPTAVQDGENGLLVRAGDTNGLAAAIRELLVDPQRRAQMSRVARERAVTRFSLERMVAETEAILSRAAEGRFR